MKRFAFLTILLLFVCSSTGCRRGLRLWGVRGGPCAQGMVGAAPRAVLPPQFPQIPQGVPGPAAAAPCCPTPTCTPCPTDCGCPTTDANYDPAYGASVAPPANGSSFVQNDTGFDVRPGETFGGVISDTGMVAPEGSVLPADTAPRVMGFNPIP
ncbi:MAG: hypothetical protein AAF497_23710 [Planctomycetota bacterium]